MKQNIINYFERRSYDKFRAITWIIAAIFVVIYFLAVFFEMLYKENINLCVIVRIISSAISLILYLINSILSKVIKNRIDFSYNALSVICFVNLILAVLMFL